MYKPQQWQNNKESKVLRQLGMDAEVSVEGMMVPQFLNSMRLKQE
jgi:hypothetical protein